MKKKLMYLAALFTGVSSAMADNVMVGELEIPQGGQTSVVVNFQFDEADQYSGWQFSLVLPEGLSTVKDSRGNATFTVGDCHDSSYTITATSNEGSDDFVALSLQSIPITGTTGTLISIPVMCDETLAIGSTLTAKLKDFQFGNKDGVHTTVIGDITFTIKVVEPVEERIILDETSTTVPSETIGANVLMKRTINAGEWSTICLPFAMEEGQLKEAFGDDVQLGDFDDYEFDDTEGTITVKFKDAKEIEANHPYIIKVSKSVTEFTVDGVDIDAQDAIIDFDTDRRHRYPRQFVGVYEAGTVLGWGSLFLSGNHFWYSNGFTKIKAFRAYFNFNDLLPDFEDNYESRSITMLFQDNETTGIHDIKRVTVDNNYYYDLQGRCVAKPRKGLLVKDGKKVIIK